ncbi:YlbF family regulator [Peribacillus asahii]|uniref:Regulator n=1 Tax=Peribacillus asahii TaxID=228899 RepID=A0A3Q9RMF0_9BACI|nr:YlbF family regulator [Peribacillus asahii]AZV42148.1 regulator [Peribacillus asahii]USK86467.1 YlbF family regulator [Peribacillus asahii]
MLATMETIEIVQKAEALAKLVMQSEIGENYFAHLYKLKNDQLAQQKIKKFVALKDLYEEVQRFGKYHPEYKRVNTDIRDAKRDMDLHPTIVDFKRAEMDLQTVLDEISMKIGRAVSPQIKVPTGNPFFDSGSGCSGGCGTGGSCGCS